MEVILKNLRKIKKLLFHEKMQKYFSKDNSRSL